MRTKLTAAAIVLAASVAVFLKLGTLPDQPSQFDTQGGPVVTTCWTVDVAVPCAGGQFPLAVCPTTEDEIVRLRVIAPVDPDLIPTSVKEIGSSAEVVADSVKETPGSCPSNGKTIQVVGPADDGVACVIGDVTGGGAGRRGARCCAAGCSCAGPICVQVPRVEVAGHEGVGDRRLCRLVRSTGSPPAAAVTYCDNRGL